MSRLYSRKVRLSHKCEFLRRPQNTDPRVGGVHGAIECDGKIGCHSPVQFAVFAKRSEGIGAVTTPVTLTTVIPTDVTDDAAAAISSVGMMRAMNARTVKSAGWAADAI